MNYRDDCAGFCFLRRFSEEVSDQWIRPTEENLLREQGTSKGASTFMKCSGWGASDRIMTGNRECQIFNLGIAYTGGARDAPSVRRIGEGCELASELYKPGNNPAIMPPRDVPVPQRQDVFERPCFSRSYPDHFSSQFQSLRLNQRLRT